MHEQGKYSLELWHILISVKKWVYLCLSRPKIWLFFGIFYKIVHTDVLKQFVYQVQKTYFALVEWEQLGQTYNFVHTYLKTCLHGVTIFAVSGRKIYSNVCFQSLNLAWTSKSEINGSVCHLYWQLRSFMLVENFSIMVKRLGSER
jgi:hypothetical protein